MITVATIASMLKVRGGEPTRRNWLLGQITKRTPARAMRKCKAAVNGALGRKKLETPCRTIGLEARLPTTPGICIPAHHRGLWDLMTFLPYLCAGAVGGDMVCRSSIRMSVSERHSHSNERHALPTHLSRTNRDHSWWAL